MSSVWRRGQPCGPLRDRSGAGGGASAGRHRASDGSLAPSDPRTPTASARLSTPSRITPHVCVWWDLWMPSLHAAQRSATIQPNPPAPPRPTDTLRRPPRYLPPHPARSCAHAVAMDDGGVTIDRRRRPAAAPAGWLDSRHSFALPALQVARC